MTPQPTIAHYRITTKLGEGGMGAVYRATDTKLARDVAIKVLPDAFAADPDRLARFTREAQVLASLNHPNIAAIYGVEDRALILELVEGPTLADRIAQGPIPLDEALPIARQIAEALEYAHEKGIVHRDLKPANIKVTPEGRVKVLDFGLAKALSNDPVAADPASSPTMTMRATMAGLIMGTAGYMSPEQAKGKPVDRRADIWAFGIILAEVLTGRQVYTGETVSEVLASVILKEPGIPDSAPPHIRALLRRCLDRDPQTRLRDIGEARIAIDRPAAAEPSAAAPAPQPRSRRALVGALVAIPLALIAGAGLAWYATRPPLRPMQRFSADLGPDALTGPRITAVLSPDGTRLVFPVRSASGLNVLAIRLMDQPKASILSGTENAAEAFFSPDGQWIAFNAEQKLKKISVQGGAAVTLCDTEQMRGGAWADDGNIYASLDGFHLSRIPAVGGKAELVVPDGAADEHAGHAHRWPQALPGRSLLVTSGQTGVGGWEDAAAEVLDLKSGRFRTVQRGGYFARYLPSGHLVYVHQSTLFALPFDLGRMAVRGTPAPVLEDIAGASNTGAGQFSFSDSGAFVYLNGNNNPVAIPAMWVDASGGRKALLTNAPSRPFSPRISPDGSKLAVSLNGDISVYDPARGSLSRLSFSGAANNQYAVWAPDGKHIVYAPSSGGIWWVRSDGAGQPELLYAVKDGNAYPTSFSPDGRRLAFHQNAQKSSRDIWILPLDLTDSDHPKAGKPELFVATSMPDVEAQFSPDGKWIAYTSVESGVYQVYVRPYPLRDAGGKWQISTNVGRFPLWSRSAKELFYLAANRIMVVPYTASGDTFSPGPPRQWSNIALSLSGNLQPYDIAPDGKRFVIFPASDTANGEKSNLHVTFLLNFFDELKRRMP